MKGKTKKSDYWDFEVDHPSCALATQREHLDGSRYKDFDQLMRSLRKGSVVRVFRPFLLGGTAGKGAKRRRVWAERAAQIEAAGCSLVSIDPPLSGPTLAMLAYEQIGNIARGKAGVSKPGRPKKDFTPEQLAVIREHWPPRRGVTNAQAMATINAKIKPRRVSYGWLRENIK